jgi:hypothetical protein
LYRLLLSFSQSGALDRSVASLAAQIEGDSSVSEASKCEWLTELLDCHLQRPARSELGRDAYSEPADGGGRHMNGGGAVHLRPQARHGDMQPDSAATGGGAAGLLHKPPPSFLMSDSAPSSAAASPPPQRSERWALPSAGEDDGEKADGDDGPWRALGGAAAERGSSEMLPVGSEPTSSIESELSRNKFELEALEAKHREVKTKYLKQSIRQTELQEYLLRIQQAHPHLMLPSNGMPHAGSGSQTWDSFVRTANETLAQRMGLQPPQPPPQPQPLGIVTSEWSEELEPLPMGPMHLPMATRIREKTAAEKSTGKGRAGHSPSPGTSPAPKSRGGSRPEGHVPRKASGMSTAPAKATAGSGATSGRRSITPKRGKSPQPKGAAGAARAAVRG